MVTQFKNIIEVKGSLMRGDVVITLEEGVVLDNGQTIKETKNIAFSFSDVLSTPKVVETPELQQVQSDPSDPKSPLIDYVPNEKSVNRADMAALRIKTLADAIGDDNRPYLQIVSAWNTLLAEKEAEEASTAAEEASTAAE